MSARPPRLWEARPVNDLTIECPRCGSTVTAAFYGPCETCRTDLRATLGGDATGLAAVEYEPKMNVTPNAVALKDD